MSQIFKHNPVSLRMDDPSEILGISLEKTVDIAAKGARFEVDGEHYRVSPRYQKITQPTVFLQEGLGEDGVSQELTRHLKKLFKELEQGQKDYALREAGNKATLRGPQADPTVAFYGFAQLRFETRERFASLCPETDNVYIDTLNLRLGLTAAIKNYDLGSALDAISGPLQYREDSLEGQWQCYLREHFSELDICNKLAHKTMEGMQANDPWLEKFACKNINKLWRSIYFEKPDNAQKLINWAMQKAAGKTAEVTEPLLEQAFEKICISAFIRSVCKLGLNFFYQQNIPVVFHWTDLRGRPFSLSDPNPGKHWQEIQGVKELHKCYTLSEMHRVQKHGLDVHRVYG